MEADKDKEKEKEKDTYKRLKNYDEDIKNFKRISDAHGCTGNEDKVRAVLKGMITPLLMSLKLIQSEICSALSKGRPILK